MIGTGAVLGLDDGSSEGTGVGKLVGLQVGPDVGLGVARVGLGVITSDGCGVSLVGDAVAIVGLMVIALHDGDADGDSVGLSVGPHVG